MNDPLILTAYQRGNRDGLLALAIWAEEQAKIYDVDYKNMKEKIVNMNRLTYDLAVTHSLIRAETYRSIAHHARRMAESLPIDPEET